PRLPRYLHSFPTRRSSDLPRDRVRRGADLHPAARHVARASIRVLWDQASGASVNFLWTAAPAEDRTIDASDRSAGRPSATSGVRSEEHTSELQSRENLVCR